MKFHGITMAGPFVSQKLAALPVFDPTKDPGRIVWLTNGTIWYGGITEWRGFASSDFEVAKEEDFYSDLLRTTIFLNASWDGFGNEDMIGSTDMTYVHTGNRLDYTTGQTLTSKNIYDPRSNATKITYLLPYVEYTNTSGSLPTIQISTNGGTNWSTIQIGRIARIPDDVAGIDIRLKFIAAGSGYISSWGVLYNKDLSAACSKYGLTYSRFVAVPVQSVFPVEYTPNAIQVFVNGDLMDEDDYDATTGEFIEFAQPLEEGDIVYILTFSTSSISSDTDYILRTGAVAFTGQQSMGGNKLVNLATGNISTDAANVGQVYDIVNDTVDDYIKADGTKVFTANQSMGSHRLTMVANAVNANDAVNLSQLTSTVNSSVLSVEGRTGHVTLTKVDVGLSNVDNTSDVNKPVSTAQQTALNLKANLASPSFTGVPTAPTADTSNDSNQIATTAYVKSQNFASTSGVTDIFVNLPMETTGGSTPTLSILNATPLQSGLMSAADKFILDNIVLGTGTVTNIATTDGVSGGPITSTGTIRLTGQALAYHNLATNGLVTRTSAGNITARTIVNGDGITVTNGNGVTGNPTIINTDRGSNQNIFKSVISPGQPTITAPLNDSSLILTGAGVSVLLDNSTSTVHLANSDAGSSQSIFKRFMVAGQTTLTASSNDDYITLAAGTNIEVTTNTVDNTITINNTNLDLGSSQNIFKNIGVIDGNGLGGGLVASNNDDTITFAAGKNIDLYVDGSDNSILITGKSAVTWSPAIEDTYTILNAGYFVDTTSGVITLMLPGEPDPPPSGSWPPDEPYPPSAFWPPAVSGEPYPPSGYWPPPIPPTIVPEVGDTIIIHDLVGNFSVNNCIVKGNGNNINGSTTDLTLNTNNKTVTLIYSNPTVGWKVVYVQN